jgi:hypothetical protein
METQELVSQCNMTHWTHMEVMEWLFYAVACLQPASVLAETQWQRRSNFLQAAAQKVTWIGTDGDPQELVSQCNMTHWTHMEVMEWFSSIICCGMSSKGNSFG